MAVGQRITHLRKLLSTRNGKMLKNIYMDA